jgi:hypothetical protein
MEFRDILARRRMHRAFSPFRRRSVARVRASRRRPLDEVVRWEHW